MKFRSLGVAAIALILPFAAVACGGKDDNDSGERPTLEQIKSDLTTTFEAEAPGQVTETQIDCMAKGYYDSKLPNGVVRKVVKNEDAMVDKKNQDEYAKIQEGIGAECLGGIPAS